jgi:TolA-binding protein
MMPLTRQARFVPARGFAILVAILIFGSITSAADQDTPLVQLEGLLQQKSFDEAVKVGRKLDDEPDEKVDVTLPLARLARALQQADRLELAAEFYVRSVEASTRGVADGLEFQKKVLVRLAAGAVLAQVNQLVEAIDVLQPTLEAESGVTESQRDMAISVLLRVGATALATGLPEVASRAYGLASEHAAGNQHATAMLGDAWAMALERKDPVAAARKLASFIDRYPDHVDAPRAARACADCLKQAQRDEDASAMLADLLHRWPDSDSAFEVVAAHRDLAVGAMPSAVKTWLVECGESGRLEKLDVAMTAQALLAASNERAGAAWGKLAQHFGSIDTTGQPTSDLLVKLSTTGKESDAERLASIIISPVDGGKVAAGAREAACRWAGRTQRWSMLALASESESPERADDSRTIAVERLLAESLMQLGRVAEARPWWNHLVDTRHADDFSTLLRCAEAETAVGSDAGDAQRRIDAARAAAAEDRFQQSLVDLLDAELSIRRSQFDEARGLLEKVVRMNETEASLRGRAQWLIGETHYLQHDFADAIEAYRRVEGIDPGGMWVSAALVQAGKSFEQLGRTREAAVCYGNLLDRFADTAHAELARRRLAAISPDAGPSVRSSEAPLRR